MARSPLMHMVLQIVRRIEIDGGARTPSAPRSREALSRRDLLLGGTVLAAAAVGCASRASPQAPPAVPPPLPAASSPPQPSQPPAPATAGVVVVGGGIAGLVCAYRLKQASIPVRLFESQTRVGGRMWSSGEQFPGRVVELGGEFIDVGHKALRALVEEFHLELEDLRKDERGLRPAYFFGGKVRSEPELVAAMRPAVVKMKRDIEKIGDAPVPYEATGAFRALDAWSIDQWLRENRVTGWIGDLLRVAFTAELGLDPDDLSCIPMLQVVAIQGNKVQLYGDSDEGARIRGGTDQLPTRIAAQLGAAVEYETSLEAISKLPDGHVRLALKRGATSFDVKAERVVLALPFSTLRKVTIDESLRFSDRKMRSIQNLGYGTNAKLLIGYKSRAWRNSGFTGEIFTDRPFQSTWDETRAQSGAPGVLTVYTGGTAGVRLGDGDLDARGQSIVGQIEWVIPHTKAEAEGIFHRFPWPSFAPSLGSYSTWRVGQMTAFGGIEAAVEGGNVHFAGEHTSLAEQGFMDGAVESGERAAREVAGAMGIALPGQKAQAA